MKNDLYKYSEEELRAELKRKEEKRLNDKGLYDCYCIRCGRHIESKFPTANICDQCAH
jgi:hypothetical protein